MIRVTLYTREGCHLCDQARADFEALQSEIPHQLVEVGIDSNPDLRDRFFEIVPVAQIGPYKLEALFTMTDLRVALGAARDNLRQTQSVNIVKRKRAIQLHKGLLFFARHWLTVFNLFAFIYIGLPFSAPILMKVGAIRPARLIQKIYSPLCHQLAYRTWFLFGEQAAYPLEAAGTSLTPYSEATGMDEGDFWAAKVFMGNERLGYKVVLCQRDIAIYGGILLAGLLFGLVRDRLKPLPIVLWFLFGVIPILLDGGLQILCRFPLLSFPIWESTPFIRTLTGALFGIMNVWMAYPYLEESMEETKILVASKLAGAVQKTQT